MITITSSPCIRGCGFSLSLSLPLFFLLGSRDYFQTVRAKQNKEPACTCVSCVLMRARVYEYSLCVRVLVRVLKGVVLGRYIHSLTEHTPFSTSLKSSFVSRTESSPLLVQNINTTDARSRSAFDSRLYDEMTQEY